LPWSLPGGRRLEDARARTSSAPSAAGTRPDSGGPDLIPAVSARRGLCAAQPHVDVAPLEGTCPLHLDVLPRDQALKLLGRIAGPDRIAADPETAAQVVRVCGYLPLAIRIAGARLAARPGWEVGVLAERLADATARLEDLEAGELCRPASRSP
jgi:hypothetical protein